MAGEDNGKGGKVQEIKRRSWGRLYAGTRNHRNIRTLREIHPNIWKSWYILIELAIECNDNGWIQSNPNLPLTWKSLASDLDIKRIDHVRRFIETLENLGMVETEPTRFSDGPFKDCRRIRLVSFNDRNYESDSSRDRTREWRKRLKNPDGEGENVTSPRRHRDVPEQNRTEQNRTDNNKQSATTKKNRSKKAKSDPPEIAVSLPSFDLTKDFYQEILSDFGGLGESVINAELKKASIYAQDRPKKYARGKDGRLVYARSYIMNWLTRAANSAGVTIGKAADPDAQKYRAEADPNCPHCGGCGISDVYEEGKHVGAQVCSCRHLDRKKKKPGNGKVKGEKMISPDPACRLCNAGLITLPSGKITVCDCIKKQTGDLNVNESRTTAGAGATS